MNKTKSKNSKTSEKPKTLWAVWGNGYGFRGPLQVHWSEQLGSWWAKNGDDAVEKIGLNWKDLYFSFASESLEEVKTFAQGYLACSKIVQNASKVYETTLKKIS